MIHNHEVRSSILRPATWKSSTYEVFVSAFLMLGNFRGTWNFVISFNFQHFHKYYSFYIFRLNGNLHFLQHRHKAGIANDKQMVQWTFVVSGSPLGEACAACLEQLACLCKLRCLYADFVSMNITSPWHSLGTFMSRRSVKTPYIQHFAYLRDMKLAILCHVNCDAKELAHTYAWHTNTRPYHRFLASDAEI